MCIDFILDLTPKIRSIIKSVCLLFIVFYSYNAFRVEKCSELLNCCFTINI